MKSIAIVFILCITMIPSAFAVSVMDQLEIEIGKSVDSQIKSEYPVLKDPEMTAYIARLCDGLVANSSRKNLKYTYTILNDNQTVNAFSGPGGYIYVTTGLMRLCDNNAELMGVLAHEIAHVAHHDQMDAMGIGLGLTALATLATGGSPEMVQAGMNVALGLIQNGYSREDEKEADLSAVDYLVGAGMQPWAMIDFFEKMQKKLGDVKGIDVYFSSHPSTEQRIKDIKAKIMKLGAAKVDDLPYGEEDFQKNIAKRLK
jgi:beta-barrel assembly-enhancing protease